MKSRRETSSQPGRQLKLEDIRTQAFGGYDKRETRQYISGILKENGDETNVLKSKIQKLKQVSARLMAEAREMDAQMARQQKLYMDAIAAQNSQITRLSVQLTAKGEAEAAYYLKLEQLALAEAEIRRQAEQTSRECARLLDQAKNGAKTHEQLAADRLAKVDLACREKLDAAAAEAARIRREADRYLQQFVQDLRSTLHWAEKCCLRAPADPPDRPAPGKHTRAADGAEKQPAQKNLPGIIRLNK